MKIVKAKSVTEDLIVKLEALGVNHDYIKTLRTISGLMDMTPSLLPFKEGDRVFLNKNLDFQKYWGWKNFDKFLYDGSPGTVMDIELDGRDVIYLVVFDEDNFRHRDIKMKNCLNHFPLRAKELTLLSEKTAAPQVCENIYGEYLW